MKYFKRYAHPHIQQVFALQNRYTLVGFFYSYNDKYYFAQPKIKIERELFGIFFRGKMLNMCGASKRYATKSEIKIIKRCEMFSEKTLKRKNSIKRF